MPPDKKLIFLSKLNLPINKNAKILDLGCGSGKSVYALLDLGYTDVSGYDIVDYLELRDEEDRRFFYINSEKSLPFDLDTFDFVFSDQVFEHVLDQKTLCSELFRIMKPGAISIHTFPAKYCPIEPHIYVPMGGFIPHYWWYKLWASAGIRNRFQKGLSATETAHRNSMYFINGLNYLSNSLYRVLWKDTGFEWRWIIKDYLIHSERKHEKLIGNTMKYVPIIEWLVLNFHSRFVLLKKPTAINS